MWPRCHSSAAELAGPRSPDIGWVRHALQQVASSGIPDAFSILRPTSPFRTADTMRRAWTAFQSDGRADSLRAVELCHEHPAKMWFITGNRMRPVLENPDRGGTPWHSQPYQALPSVYVQNASLEIARTEVVLVDGSIAGRESCLLDQRSRGFRHQLGSATGHCEHPAANPDALPAVQPAG